MRTVLYSLRTVNERTVLSIDLTGLLISDTHYTFQIKLASGEIFLQKWDYLNKMKIYDDGDVFFIICTAKKVSRESAFNCLMEYALNKVDATLEKLSEDADKINQRIGKLTNFKHRIESEIAA